MNLNKESSLGHFEKIKNLFDKNKFSQKEIDEAFRECISGYKKNEMDSFRESIKFFLKKTPEINYQNPRFNNMTILMHAIDESKEAATDLIISCSKEELSMKISDNNGDNTLFHIINNNTFSNETKISFIRDLYLNDCDFLYKNRNNETIIGILKSKGNFDLLEEIQKKRNENKFNQNELTLFYNNKNYEELYQRIEKIEFLQKMKRFNIQLNNICIQYTKAFIELKDNRMPEEDKFKILIEKEEKLTMAKISERLFKIMSILSNIFVDEGGGKNMFCACLFINKLIMFYFLDNYNEFLAFKNNIEKYTNYFIKKHIYLNAYTYLISIDMKLQRGYYLDASYELDDIKNKFDNNQEHIIKIRKHIEKKKLIIPNDLLIDINRINPLFDLYRIFINSFICERKKEKYDSLLTDLKKVNIGENDSNKGSISTISLKNFQQNLFLKLHYLSNSNKEKVSYIIPDKFFKLNINGTNDPFTEINRINYYNYLGIISLKNKYYYMASYFFLKCLNITSETTSIQLLKRNHYYPSIIFNLGLSYFYSKKYQTSFKYFFMLLNYSNNKSKYFINNKYLYYRLGLSNLFFALQNGKDDGKGELLYNTFIKNKFILNIPKKSSLKEKIDIEYFKKAFIIIRKNPNDPIYFKTLINIVFCNILKENYNEAIFYLKSNKSKDINNINIVRFYLIQCYIYINKISLAEKISREMIMDDRGFRTNNSNMKFYENLNMRLINLKGYRIAMLINLIKINVAKKKVKELQKNMISILDSIKLNISLGEEGKINANEEIPTYIINIFVYYYLLINRKDLAIDIMKKRTIKEILINDVSL